MPRFPEIPRIRLVTGFALLLSAYIIPRSLLGRVVGNPIICAEAGRPYSVVKLREFYISLSSRLARVKSIPRPHAELEQWEMREILLSPDNQFFAVSEIEYILSSGQDETVSILSLDTGSQLYFATDNTAAPSQTYQGTDADIPQLLVEEQERSDMEWQSLRQNNPSLPRAVVTGEFSDNDGRGQLAIVGWLTGNGLALSGRSPIAINSPLIGNYESEDMVDWWAVVGALPASGWGILARGHGALPATYQPILSIQQQVSVDLIGGKIFLEGQPQKGFGMVVALDGPHVDYL